MILWVRRLLWISLALSGICIAARAFIGPFQFLLPVANPANPAGVFALCGAGLIASGARRSVPPKFAPAGMPGALAPAALLLVTILAFWRLLPQPFLADDYEHIPHAIAATPTSLASNFYLPAADRFFRPAVFALYAGEARIAGYSIAIWHALSIALHAAVTLLVYFFLRRRQFSPPIAFAAALLFLLHGSRPEAVAWVSAQFDLWAALFFLLALLAFDSGQRVLSLAPLALALLSKESAYVYPLILAWMLFIDRVPFARWPRLVAPSAALVLAAFIYRWSIVGGIGGYQDVGTGRAYILTFNLGRTLKAFALRYNAALVFPINWSPPLQWWLLAALLGALALGACLFAVRAGTRRLLFGAGFLLLAALPVHEFLLLDADLEKSRVLYLPSVGLALLFAAVLEGAQSRTALWAAAAVLAFQTAALEHNLGIWRRVAELAEHSCAQAASIAGPVALSDISNVVDGVYFLHTGLRGCIQHAGKSDVYLVGQTAPGDATHLEWNAQARSWVRR